MISFVRRKNFDCKVLGLMEATVYMVEGEKLRMCRHKVQ